MVEKSLREFLIYLQNVMKKLIVFEKIDINKIENVLAADIAYKRDKGIAVSVVYNIKNDYILENSFATGKIEFPYIPGLLFFREAPLMLQSIKKISTNYDVILVDAHGYAHPRRMGLATVIGIIMDKPTIGIAKSLLTGKIRKIDERLGEIVDKDEVIGYEVMGDRKFYVSPGNKIDFDSVLEFIRILDFKYPKAVRIADKLTKEYKNKF